MAQNNALAPRSLNALVNRWESATPLERETYRQTGMEPGLKRKNIIPSYSEKSGITLPQWAYEAAKDLVSFGAAAKGVPISQDEINNIAFNLATGGFMGGAASSLAGKPLQGNVGMGGAQLFRGRQIGQVEKPATWWSTSKEMAESFANKVRGKKKPSTTGEVISDVMPSVEKTIDSNLFVTDYPTYETAAKSLGLSYEEVQKAMQNSPKTSMDNLLSEDMAPTQQVRFHTFVEMPSIQNLLTKKGITHVKAKEIFRPNAPVDTYLKLPSND